MRLRMNYQTRLIFFAGGKLKFALVFQNTILRFIPELLRSPSSSHSPLVNIPDLPLHYNNDDGDYDTSALLSTLNRHKSLLEFEDDYGHMSQLKSITVVWPWPGKVQDGRR